MTWEVGYALSSAVRGPGSSIWLDGPNTTTSVDGESHAGNPAVPHPPDLVCAKVLVSMGPSRVGVSPIIVPRPGRLERGAAMISRTFPRAHLVNNVRSAV